MKRRKKRKRRTKREIVEDQIDAMRLQCEWAYFSLLDFQYRVELAIRNREALYIA